ncbi:MAG: DUF2189 domain-containing protein [Candidatus Competibacterales bacterium]
MSSDTIPVDQGSLVTPRVRRVTADDPWVWLTKGWRDTRETLGPSLAYGAIFVVMGYALLQYIQFEFRFMLVLTAGFFLVGPFLATGLYDLSKRLEEGDEPTLGKALFAWRGNIKGIMLFGLLVGIIMVVWVRLAALVYALLVASSDSFVVSDSVDQLFFSGAGLTFLIAFTLVGGVLAALVFAIGAVSIPMMVDDKNSDIFTAVVTSFTAVRHNLGPMTLWAALIVVFIGAGLLTFYLGLAITLPIVGHGTWHAYRALVERSDLPLPADASVSPPADQ